MIVRNKLHWMKKSIVFLEIYKAQKHPTQLHDLDLAMGVKCTRLRQDKRADVDIQVPSKRKDVYLNKKSEIGTRLKS